MSKRYALVGLSNRGVASFALPMLGLDRDGVPTGEGHTDVATLVACIEPDVVRFEAFNAWLAEHDQPTLRRYDSVADLVAGEQIDVLIIASPDHTHMGYIRDGLAHGLDVLTEKPMVTTTAEAEEVLRLEKASSNKVVVTHNFRYPPRHVQVKELIRSGRIGRVVQVLLEYHVDTAHGSSYFVRWNRSKAASGGLTLHKSTHHLDLIGWLIDDEPVRVASSGGTYFYGPDSPFRPKDEAGNPLTGQALLDADPYWNAMLERGQVSAPEPGQPRRGALGLPYPLQYPADTQLTVYDDEIDSVDTITSLVSYRGGAALSYLVNFSSPWEGFRLTVIGTHGQIEAISGSQEGEAVPGTDVITVRPLFGEVETLPVATGEGGHGGADPLMLRDLFRGPTPESLALGLPADARQGALAVATGEALWRSAETGETITIDL